jgi:hypothetical protein
MIRGKDKFIPKESLKMELDSPEWIDATKHVPWVVLYLDGQSTHHDAKTFEYARYYKILLCTFIPHTTHLVQPLDSGINTAIKVCFFRLLPFL